MKTAIVAPCHIQPSEEWIKALWDEAQASGAYVIIVDDSDGKITLPWGPGKGGDVFGYAAQKKELGDELYALFEQFHQSSSCKNFGTWLAWRDGYEAVIVIDSDCIMRPGFVAEHLVLLEQKGMGWANPLVGTGMYSRGFPYSQRDLPKWAHMGLWTHSLDLYGTDRMKGPVVPLNRSDMEERPEVKYVCSAAPFPLSGMNVSFRGDAIPFMLFLPNFKYLRHKFSRHDDIWGGYIFQKIARQKGASLSYGLPYVEHDTKVVAEEDAKEEEAMIRFEDEFYRAIDDALVFSGSGCANHSGSEIFAWLSQEIGANETFGALRDAFKFWALAFR